jgi:hypothetical protein
MRSIQSETTEKSPDKKIIIWKKKTGQTKTKFFLKNSVIVISAEMNLRPPQLFFPRLLQTQNPSPFNVFNYHRV